MLSFKIFAIVLMASSVYASDRCWRKGVQTFFKVFAAGDAANNVKPLDPATVLNINVPEEGLEINTYLPELKVTMLKNAIVKDYTRDPKTNLVQFSLKFDLVAEGPVSLQFPKKNKNLNGTIIYEADINGHIKYLFNHEKVGEETITCEALNAKYTIDNDFIQLLENDSDASALEPRYDSIHNEHVKKVVCEIAKATMRVFVEDFRNIVNHL